MKGIIVTGHGNFASGIESTMKLIMGEQEKTVFIDFKEGMTNIELSENIEKIVKEIGEKGVLIFTDILGGTPFNEAAMISTKYDNIHVFAGLNMAMLFEAIDCREDEIDTDRILEESKNGMGIFKIVEELSEESDSDGI
ncbi:MULTISPECIES: PTS sugar transporter subunit IIA [Fusobacterium]|jgi:PTS system N-acetylgalactosamine-specific IIA component|uniref:PTS sugar transporter subunit IIA n=1 Tax=Fusobacterium TaxID=848 RepID=UPI001032AC3C|nr:PTS sugar transporter subunit IIA [Fusobacterium ulcerans]